jgi:hypothetical protein
VQGPGEPTSLLAWSNGFIFKLQEQVGMRGKEEKNWRSLIKGCWFLVSLESRNTSRCQASPHRHTEDVPTDCGFLTRKRDFSEPLSLGRGYIGAQNSAQRNYLKPFRNKKSCVKLNLCF